jgi:8-oxo-dGTP pyrophosphatase MutT (NUDIX family)
MNLERSSAPDIRIGTLDRAHIKFENWTWPFAVRERAAIDANFARLKRERPGVWNGRVLLLNQYEIRERELHGTCFEADYASFTAWRNFEPADAGAFNFFADAAVLTADGAYLVGEMGSHTAGAGKRYFPSGTPEPDDLDASGMLDVEGNLRRELLEETGLHMAELDAAPGFTLVRDGGTLALIKTLRARDTAQELRRRIMTFIDGEENPELSDIHIVRSPDDFDPTMPRYVMAFLTHCWSVETK